MKKELKKRSDGMIKEAEAEMLRLRAEIEAAEQRAADGAGAETAGPSAAGGPPQAMVLKVKKVGGGGGVAEVSASAEPDAVVETV